MVKKQKVIEVDVDEKGNVKTEASGFSGKECLKATLDIEQALGVVSKRTTKAEMHQVVIGDKAVVGGK